MNRICCYLGTSMEVAMISTIRLIQSVIDVTSSMGVYNVKNDIETKTVCLVHKILELVWRPVYSSKEAGHMISKTDIVSMLHDCHQFNTVVAKVFDTKEHVISKVGIAGNLGFGRRDSNVTFIDAKAFWLSRSLVAIAICSHHPLGSNVCADNDKSMLTSSIWTTYLVKETFAILASGHPCL